MDSASVWRDYADRLKRFIVSRIRPPLQADDILQDVFIKVHTHMNALRDEQSLSAWLYQITRHTIADHGRRLGKTEPPVPSDDVSDDETPYTELEHCLQPMMMQLNAQDRAILTAVDINNKSQKALAAEWNMSESGAKSRVQRARQRLKQNFLACCDYEWNRRGEMVDFKTDDSCEHQACSTPSSTAGK